MFLKAPHTTFAISGTEIRLEMAKKSQENSKYNLNFTSSSLSWLSFILHFIHPLPARSLIIGLPGAIPRSLQCHTTCKIQNGKMADGVWKSFYLQSNSPYKFFLFEHSSYEKSRLQRKQVQILYSSCGVTKTKHNAYFDSMLIFFTIYYIFNYHRINFYIFID